MQRRVLAVVIAALVSVFAIVASAPAQPSTGINAYRVKATAKNLERLAMAGFDVTEGRRVRGMIEVYGTAKQMTRLQRKAKLRTRLVEDRRGRTSVQRSRRQVLRGLSKLGVRARSSAVDPTANASDAAYKVYTKYDAVPNDGHEQYTEFYNRIVAQHDDIAAKVVLGQTEWNRDIIAIQVTRNAQGRDNGKPAVLYNALQHAREWLAGQTCKRTLDYFTRWYGKDKQITRLVNERQLWFVCVSNPDGYEFTFTPGNRLWRKNLHEVNGVDGIQLGDGVDPNRNYPVDWGLDNEGSSPDPASETYRGDAPASEPETQAMLDLWNMVDFEFQKNDHTAAELILYPQGWQQYTPAADDPIFTALAGDDRNPAIQGFDPDLGAELYITNGDTLDTAYNQKGILAYTPEGSVPQDPSVSGFEFEDTEGLIDGEFRDHLAFSLDLAESADDPANPESHLRNTVSNFYVDSFAYSYGDPQTVQVLAKKDLGAVVMKYKVNGVARPPVATTEWSDGQRYYQEAGEYYHRLRAQVTGTNTGDSVEVWFEQAGGAHRRSPSFTYSAVNDTDNRVLVLAAEDYTGPTPADADGQPNYLQGYVDELANNGFTPDVYDVDARNRKAPDPLGVLSHYDAVVWYTGDDYLTREPGQVPGTGTSRLALDEIVAIRDYLNEGGKVLLAGKHAGQEFFEGYEFRNEGFPQPNEDKHGDWCDSLLPEARDGCIAHTDDFFQYYMGSYLRVEDGGSWNDANGEVRPVVGTSPFSGTWTPGSTPGDPAAGAPTSTLASTSSLLHTDAYDDFSEVIGSWARTEAGPFSPHGGSKYLYSGTADEAYMRLHREVAVPASGDVTLKFFTSFDIEQDWDFFFVEAAPAGSDDWTTLPDANGHTTQATGESCHDGGGWGALHERVLHYQTVSGDTCSPTGTTGEWNAATGSSGGWQEWSVDLSAYRGQTIDLAMVYATDWAVQNLGVWLDDITLTLGGTTLSTDFEGSDLGGWERGSLPPPHNQATWNAAPSTQTFQEGAVIGTKDLTFSTGGVGTTSYQTTATRDTVYAGFELGTLSAEDRRAFLEEVLEYFELKAPDAE
jgi:murein tripeptide amidase MpaA